MADGYGFGAEGDWKTAALLRAAKVMAAGRAGGTSFMEDYTYDLSPGGGYVLGAHMLEVCPSLADARPSCEVHPLSIGGRGDPVRLVFTARAGPAVNVALVDLGERFRLLVNVVDVVRPDKPLPKLPVARALWRPRPDLPTAAESWLVAGGPITPCSARRSMSTCSRLRRDRRHRDWS
jgi:L-arabinose isomerase